MGESRVKKYNDGGITLRRAFEEAKREALECNRSVMFEFALVKLVVGPESECDFGFIQGEFREGVKQISHITDQL